MNILFIADIHIKLNQKNVPKQWQKDRYNKLWESVIDTALKHECRAIVNGGDIFDGIPTTEELAIFFDMLSAFQDFEHIIYPGNHEAKAKTTSWLSHFKSVARSFETNIVDEWTPGYFPGVDILPYTDLKTKKWHGGGDILLTHVRGSIPPHVQPEVDLELFKDWNLVIAGDLHAHSNSQLNIVYPGSPMTTTFHRKETVGENGVLILDTMTRKWKHINLCLPQLIRETVSSPSEMIKTEYNHTIYELVGNLEDLSVAVDPELLDKKITTRDSEATLNLNNKTIEEELYEYLIEVENIKDPQAIIKEFHDHIA